MRKVNDWVKGQAVQKLEMYEFVRRIQLDAYNSGIRDSLTSVTLCVKTKLGITQVGKTQETYSPAQGIKTIMVDATSILKLLKDE